jgi:hypothetical protein
VLFCLSVDKSRITEKPLAALALKILRNPRNLLAAGALCAALGAADKPKCKAKNIF